jgi:hypothetical protein
MKQLQLKCYSCPFDWLGTNLEHISEILEADFQTFMDPKYLCDHSDNDPRKCGHALYGGHFFHHFNPRIPNHCDYYSRCVERFKAVKLFNSSQHVLYIHQAFYLEPTADTIARLHAQLVRYRGSDDFTLLFVYYSKINSHMSYTVKSFVHHPANVILVEATMLKDINGVSYLHPSDMKGMCGLLDSLFDFSSITTHPFNVSDIQEEKSYCHDITL